MKKLMLCCFILLGMNQSAQANILVPAYFYPSSITSLSYWDELTGAASHTQITAIINPNSGSGIAANSDYTTAINNFRAAGGKAIAYVHTNYGMRDKAEVLAEVNLYKSFYGIDGIFLDEMSNKNNDLNYYQSLYGSIKLINPNYSVFANPGTNTAESFLSAADVLVTYENDPASSNYVSYVPEVWTQNYAANRFAHLFYNVPNLEDMLSLAMLADGKNVGYTYFTDDVLPNPWDTLPTYWDAEVSRNPSNVPLPSSALLMLSALAIFGVVNCKGSKQE